MVVIYNIFLKCKVPLCLAMIIGAAWIWTGCRQSPGKTEHSGTAVIDSLVAAAIQIGDSNGGAARLAYLDSAFKGRQLTPDDQYRLYALKHHTYNNKLSDYDHALLYADSMLWMTEHYPMHNMGDKRFTAYKQKAEALYGLEHYKAAYQNYEVARYIADTVASASVKAKFLFGLGMAYYREEKYIESARLFARAYRICTDARAPEIQHVLYFRQQILSNAGLAYAMGGNKDSGLYYYRAALRFIAQNRNEGKDGVAAWDEARAVVYGNMATLYKQQKIPDSAMQYFNASIAVHKSAGRNVNDTKYNLIKLADLYLDMNQYDSARSLLNEVETMPDTKKAGISKEDSLELVLRLAEVQARYYSARKDYEHAYTALALHDRLQDIKSERIQKRKINNLENGIGYASNEKQLSSLVTDKKIHNQRIAILVLITGLCVFGLIIIYYYMRLHKLNSQKLELEKRQIITESEQKQKELLDKIDTDRANYLALLESTDDCLWSIDRNLNILAYNKVYKEFIKVISDGKAPELGKPDVVKDVDNNFYEYFAKGYKEALTGNVYNSIDRGIYTAGQHRDFAMCFSPVFNKQGEVESITCARKDITEYFNLTNSLKKNTEQFKNIAWLQSHAIRGPLATIMGITALLDEADTLEPELREELMNGMKEKLAEMDKLVNEIVKLTY